MPYHGDCWLVYLALLKREDIFPNRVLKVGITHASDPYYRLDYNKSDEPFPICNYFSDRIIIKAVQFDSEYASQALERKIMGMVKTEFNSDKFHNWRENDCISGITEMRIWSNIEARFILNIMKSYRAYNFNNDRLLESLVK